MVEAQQRAMEMKGVNWKLQQKEDTILDKITFMEKGIKILDPERLMWTQTKQNNDKHVE